jgi:hypothetical protein
MTFSKGDKVLFYVPRGEHSMLVVRPGVVTGRQGRLLVVRCTEAGTLFFGQEYRTPEANLRKRRG